MQKTHAVIKHLDNPIRFLSLSLSDLIAYLSPFLVGSLFDSMFVIPLVGLIAVITAKRLLKKLPKSYLARFWYWNSPTNYLNRMLKTSLPDSSKRYWIG